MMTIHQLMGSTLDKNTYQQESLAMPTDPTGNKTNDFSKQFATYWSPSSEIRYENWLRTQSEQFDKQNEYDKSVYRLKSAFACTNQFISSFSGSQAGLDNAAGYTPK